MTNNRHKILSGAERDGTYDGTVKTQNVLGHCRNFPKRVVASNYYYVRIPRSHDHIDVAEPRPAGPAGRFVFGRRAPTY